LRAGAGTGALPCPPRHQGVYHDSRSGRWYFKASLGSDPLTGRRTQVTRRGFASARG
jgi:hypothetical protein